MGRGRGMPWSYSFPCIVSISSGCGCSASARAGTRVRSSSRASNCMAGWGESGGSNVEWDLLNRVCKVSFPFLPLSLGSSTSLEKIFGKTLECWCDVGFVDELGQEPRESRR